MNEYREERTVVEPAPINRARPVAATQYDSVVREKEGMSAGAIAALVLAAIAAAVAVTMLILNSQQRTSDDQLANERARADAAEQQAAQQPSSPQQPLVVVPQSQPAPATMPAQPTAPVEPTSTELESAVNSRLLDDQDLRPYSIDVKVSGGIATLSGRVPTDRLKQRAERTARSVSGIRNVINNMTVQSD